MATLLDGLTEGFLSRDTLSDWAHASRTIVSNNYELAPKPTWMYHVFFELNPIITPDVSFSNLRRLEAGILVKSIDLPKFKIDSKTYNAYNRKEIVQTKINYDPVSITFHDDAANVVRLLWHTYMTYYYRDSDFDSSTYNANRDYVPLAQGRSRFPTEWGYTPKFNPNSGLPNFFTKIQIYSLHNKQYSLYELINPKIESFENGRHDSTSTNGTLESTMRLAYEAVKYLPDSPNNMGRTIINSAVPKGFAQVHYDKHPSPLTAAGGGTKSILGPGGLVDSIGTIGSDIAVGNFGSAAYNALRTAQNLKNFNLGSIAKEEAVQAIGQVVRNVPNRSPVGVPVPSFTPGFRPPQIARPGVSTTTPSTTNAVSNTEYVPQPSDNAF